MIVDRRKFLFNCRQCPKDCQKRFWRGGLNNKPSSFLPDNCLFAGQFEFARNPDGLVSTILEDFDVALGHLAKLAYAVA